MIHFNVQQFKTGDLASGVPSTQLISADLACVAKILESLEHSNISVVRIEVVRYPIKPVVMPVAVPPVTGKHVLVSDLMEERAIPIGQGDPPIGEQIFLKFKEFPNFHTSGLWVIGIRHQSDEYFDVKVAWDSSRFHQNHFSHWLPFSALQLESSFGRFTKYESAPQQCTHT